MDQLEPTKPFMFSDLPEDVLLQMLQFLGIEAKIIAPLRMVSKDFNFAIKRLFDNHLNNLRHKIILKSKESESLLIEGKLDISCETKLLELVQSLDVIKKLPGIPQEEIKLIFNSYLNHIRKMIMFASIMDKENASTDENSLSQKEISNLIIQNTLSLECFHLLWEEDKYSEFNQCLKKIIQEDIKDAEHDPHAGKKYLKITDLRNADLSGICFGNKAQGQLVNLENVRLEGANCENSDLEGAYYIPCDELSKASCLIGLRGIKSNGDRNTSDIPLAGTFKNPNEPIWKGSIPCANEKYHLQKIMAQQYKDRISSSTNFCEVLSDLHNLVITKITATPNRVYLNAPIIDINPLNSTGSYMREVMEAGREKLMMLIKTGSINISDNNKENIKTQLDIVFHETYGRDNLTIWKTSKNEMQKNFIIEKLNLTNARSKFVPDAF